MIIEVIILTLEKLMIGHDNDKIDNDNNHWNVNHNDESLMVCIRFSKTDQYGQNTVPNISGNGMRGKHPVQAMRAYLMVRPPIKGPLSCHQDGTPLTRYQSSAVLQKIYNWRG